MRPGTGDLILIPDPGTGGMHRKREKSEKQFVSFLSAPDKLKRTGIQLFRYRKLIDSLY